MKGQYVTIELVKGNASEYIIKDAVGITLGRVYIIELHKENRYCCFRVKLYKNGDKGYIYLKDSLQLLLKSLFQNMNMQKAAVVVEETTNISVFTELGFDLEGILSSSVYINGEYRDELIFGIDVQTFNKGRISSIIKLQGKDIDLKIMTPDDAEDLTVYYRKNREHLAPYEPSREEEFFTVDIQRRNLIEGYKQYLNGVTVPFGIYKEERLIGKVQLSNIVMGVFRSAFAGYSIDKEAQGKGYMKSALNTVVKYAFEEMGLHRIEASTLIDNIRSQAVLQACGFAKLGVNKGYLFINGDWRDHITFYIINK